MRTAYLGSFGYGNLGDELCLIEALRAFPSAEAFAYSEDPEWTMRCVPGLAGTFFEYAGMLARRPKRLVVGGGAIGSRAYFRLILPHLARAQAELGTRCHIHNIGVARMGRAAEWLPEGGAEALAGLASFTVRDPRSAELVMEWEAGILPGIVPFPEVALPADPTLAEALLPQGRPLLGVSCHLGARIWRCLDHGAERVRAARPLSRPCAGAGGVHYPPAVGGRTGPRGLPPVPRHLLPRTAGGGAAAGRSRPSGGRR